MSARKGVVDPLSWFSFSCGSFTIKAIYITAIIKTYFQFDVVECCELYLVGFINPDSAFCELV